MCLIKLMPKLDQRGIAHLLVILILLAGLAGGLYLIKNPAIFNPRASVSGPVGCSFGQALSIKNVAWRDENILMISRPQPITADTPFTIDFYMKQNSRKNFNNNMLFKLGNRLHIFTETGSSGTENKLALMVSDGTNNKFFVGSNIEVGKWNHIAVTYQPTGANTGNLGLHFNGSTTNLGAVNFADNHSGIDMGGSFFDGELEEIRLVKGVAYSQVDSSYTLPGKPHSKTSDTLFLFHLDNNLTDSSGTGSSASSNGTAVFVDSTITCTFSPTPTPGPTSNPSPIPTPTPTPIGKPLFERPVNLRAERGSVTPRGSGRIVLEVLSYDSQHNVNTRLSGSLRNLLPNKIYFVEICWRDGTSCSFIVNPEVVTNAQGNADFKDLLISTTNDPKNRINSIKVVTGNRPSQPGDCPDPKNPCISGKVNVPDLSRRANPSPRAPRR